MHRKRNKLTFFDTSIQVNATPVPPLSTRSVHEHIFPSQEGLPMIQKERLSLKRPIDDDTYQIVPTEPDGSNSGSSFLPTHYIHKHDVDMVEYATGGDIRYEDFGRDGGSEDLSYA